MKCIENMLLLSLVLNFVFNPIYSSPRKLSISKGFKIGVNYSSLIGESVNHKPNYGKNIDISYYTAFDLREKLSFQFEIHFSGKGWELDGASMKEWTGWRTKGYAEFNYYSVDIPIVSKLFLNDDFFLSAGGSINYLISGTSYINGSDIETDQPLKNKLTYRIDDLNNPDFSLLVGCGFTIWKMICEFRYSIGLTRFFHHLADFRWELFQIQIGYVI